MIFHGQSTEFYEKINNLWKRRIRKSRLKIRARRWNFFGNVRSLYVKQYRGNVWGNARFKLNYAKKLSIYHDFRKDLERSFGATSTPQYLLELGSNNNISAALLRFLNRKHRNFKNQKYLRDITANKKFYRKFNKTITVRHQKSLQLHRIKSFLGNVKIKFLRDIWRSGTIKGNMFSANLFIFRFLSRLSHLLYFAGFVASLQLGIHLVKSGFVKVNTNIIIDPYYLVPVMTSVQLQLPLFYKRLCIFLLFPYHRLYVYPFLEINYNLFTVRFLRIPIYREVIFPSGYFDHMLLYEQLAQVIK